MNKKGKRVTLAIRGVRWLDTKVAIITYLLAELSTLLHLAQKKINSWNIGAINIYPAVYWSLSVSDARINISGADLYL